MKGKKVLALALAAAMTLGLGACGGKGEGLNDLYTWETSNREMEGFFILNTEKAADLNVLCNAYAGLVSTDANGKLIADVAETWGTEDDGLTWTFNLREGVKWVDVNGEVKADCTAQDWITGLEWVLNYHKNGGNNTSMPFDTIKGAEDYFNYTKELTEAEGKALGTEKFLEMVGIEAEDDYTLTYTCTAQLSYFPTVATSACLYPVSQKLIDELGVDNMIGMTNKNMWYTGPYTITSYTNQAEKVLTKNPEYYDKDCSLFDTVTIKIISDTTVGYQQYENGELDHMDLSEATLKKIYEDENHEFHDNLVEKRARKYSYQMHFNYAKVNEEDGAVDTNWNTAVANENFRKAIYYGLNLNDYWARTNFISPLHCENLAYTMKGLLYFSDGTDYVDKVIEKLGLTQDGKTAARYNADKATEYMEAAMDELKDKGVTFPVELDYYIISGSQNALDGANVLKQIFDDCLGDMITLNICDFVSNQTQEVIKPRYHSIAINGWGADYGDVQNFLGQETYGEDGAYYSNNYSNCNEVTDPELIAVYEEFTRLVNVADAIKDDMDARYDAYVDAEVYMLEHALSVPMQYEVSWQLTRVNDYTKSNAMYGIQNYLYKNWETSADAYTTDEYADLAKEASK